MPILNKYWYVHQTGLKKTIGEAEQTKLEHEADVTRSKKLKTMLQDQEPSSGSGAVKPEDESHVKMGGFVNDLRSVCPH